MRKLLIGGIIAGMIVSLALLGLIFFNSTEQVAGSILTMEKPQAKDSTPVIIGFISPHHLVAKKLMDEIFAQVAKENKNAVIDRIIIVSPNHFDAPTGNITVSGIDRETKNGVVPGDTDFVRQLNVRKNTVYINDGVFEKEHGVQALLPFIKTHFDDTKVVVAMINPGTPQVEMEELAQLLTSNHFGTTLMILSSDFSHELTPDISAIHDAKAIDVIEHFDFEKVYQLDTDCVEGLYLLMKFAQAQGYDQFVPVGNSNSSAVYRNFFIGENTSYVTGKFRRVEQKTEGEGNGVLTRKKSVAESTDDSESERGLEKSGDFNHSVQADGTLEAGEMGTRERVVTLLFGGDVMLDRATRTQIERSGVKYLTEKIKRIFWSQDFNVVNLEGPITDHASVSRVAQSNPAHFKFTFDKSQTAEFIDYNRINLVSIGNNHILNFGQNGVAQTEQFLQEHQVAFAGPPTENSGLVEGEINGKKIALVAYNDFAPPDLAQTIEQVRLAKARGNLVFVYPHWGSEYNLKTTVKQREIAHALIDAGADIIIGSHPHVIEPVETYQNGIIFYSLGNLVFDQYFSDEVRRRLIVQVEIKGDKVKFVLTPLITNGYGQLSLAPKEERVQILERIARDSLVDEATRNKIKQGVMQWK